jgi:sugar lactone lactonase YvrE
VIVGQEKHTYEVDKEWGRREGGVPAFGVSQGVSGDSQDRVYVFVRAPRAEVLVLDRDGRLLSSWGYGQFQHPHGIWISPKDELYLTDRDAHVVSKWTLDGKLLRSWGTPGKPGAPGKPFNMPTKAVEAPDGEVYVSDGYGQCRVHRFDKQGNLVDSWGEKGEGPGQFVLPHDVLVDTSGNGQRDRVLVCDRTNRRIQIFDRAGGFVGEWRDLRSPQQVFIRDGAIYTADGGQITIRTLDGELIVAMPYQTAAPRKENGPHSLWVDSRGDIYVGEVTGENGFQKFSRQ